MRHCKYWTLLLVAFSMASLKAQSGNMLYLNKTDKTDIRYNLDEVRKLTFTPTELVINKINGSQEAPVVFADLRHLTFTQFYGVGSGVGAVTSSEADFRVFPNPVKDKLIITGLTFNTREITIFDITGRKKANDQWINGEPVDVSDLSAGVYFVKIGNIALKFFKE